MGAFAAEAQESSVAQGSGGFRWRDALVQSGEYTLLLHGVRVVTEPKTRDELGGPFIRDYARAVKGIRGWSDGDYWTTNYLGHPAEGAAYGFIALQNDPRYRAAEFGKSRAYWQGRLRALGWSAIQSTQFEIGPFSEASIGNVGQKPNTAAAVDLVMTPVGGVGFMIVEDILDRFVIRPFERNHGPVARLFMRGFLNPNRSMANMIRGRVPWHRDSRAGVAVP